MCLPLLLLGILGIPRVRAVRRNHPRLTELALRFANENSSCVLKVRTVRDMCVELDKKAMQPCNGTSGRCPLIPARICEIRIDIFCAAALLRRRAYSHTDRPWRWDSYRLWMRDWARCKRHVNGMAIDERTPIKLAFFGGRVLA
jgi:hypothetical protein